MSMAGPGNAGDGLLLQEFIVDPAGADDPPIGGEPRDEATIHWDRVNSVVFRALALIWLVRGLVLYLDILGFGTAPLDKVPPLRQLFLVSFTLSHTLCAVGLWLLAPWGRNLWWFAVIAELTLALIGVPGAEDIFSLTMSVMAFALGAALFFLTRADWQQTELRSRS